MCTNCNDLGCPCCIEDKEETRASYEFHLQDLEDKLMDERS